MTTAELVRPYVPGPGAKARDVLKRHWFEIVLITPLFVYVFGTTLIPVLASILLGFQNAPRGGGFPSLDSYKLVVQDYQFISAFTNTLIVTFTSVGLELVLGLVVAMMMARPFRGRGLFRAIML
jgi:multiple sugar transport system permease protein